MSTSRYRLGVDIGGTFTDLQAMEENTGRLFALKVPSTKSDPSDAVISGITELQKRFGILPEEIVYFAHGTTLGVNTLLERNGALGGVLMTQGFTDTLELRRLRLPKANDFFVAKPVPLVARRHVKPIQERTLSNGDIRTPIQRDEVLTQTQALVDEGISTVAVCFLHAHQNPTHERQAKAWITETFSDLYVCTSAEIWPQQREYERSLISVINAYIGARMQTYFETLQRRTTALGMRCRIFSTKSNGGVMSVASAADRPVETLLSGPASGVIGAAHVGKSSGLHQFVTLDMGGTSVDVSVVTGEIRYSGENTIGDYPVIMPAVDVSAIGAGGGSIAWADTEGVLKVGPQSAGASPGPACYARGGTQPTVTDAYLCSGIIAPERFLGGEMPLDANLANQAMDGLAEKLGLSRAHTADAILQVTTSNIYAELLPQLARRGVNADSFALVAYGAAGPTQSFMLARDLNLGQVVVPPSPGTLCALGCLAADVRADFVQSIWSETSALGDDKVQGIFTELLRNAQTWLDDQGMTFEKTYVLRSVDMCYVGQSYEVNVPFPEAPDESVRVSSLIDWFHTQYEKVYGYADTTSATRVLEARLQIVGVTPKPVIKSQEDVTARRDSSPASRMIFERGESFEASVWQRESLVRGESYLGPMIVEQYDTTVYVPKEFVVHIDTQGNLIGEKRSA